MTPQTSTTEPPHAGLELMLPRNPFVGLRPFNTDESLLFFGRRQQTIELLEQLHRTHFIAVVGSSGCGKSSLIRAGLIPNLLAGFLVEERDRWLIATMKPGDAPLRNLAAALCEAAVAAPYAPEVDRVLNPLYEFGAEAILTSMAPVLSDSTNLLLLVDQFEELFRFGVGSDKPEQRGEAADFVALLLQLAEQCRLPIYIVLTMRSDFLGDCDNFHGLPEALNCSQYLVPRLTREQRRQAIEGPVRLFGAGIAPRLLDRVLNDVGDQSDQLPVLQHALMRTWERWKFAETRRKRELEQQDDAAAQPSALPLDLPQYLEAGTIKNALANDAEAALTGLTDEEVKLAERMFRALTATDANNRKIRRPVHLKELCDITGTTKDHLQKIIGRFRGNNRSFLILSDEADSLVSISHESLIRQWPRMDEWMKAEGDAADLFKRLVEAARRKREFWRGGDLAEARKWQAEQQPNEIWAQRYDKDAGALGMALKFLNYSQELEERTQAAEKARQLREAKRQQQEILFRRTRFFAIVIGVALLLAMGVAWYAYLQQQLAKARGQRAARLYYNVTMNAAQEAYERGDGAQVYQLLSAFLPSPTNRELSQNREFSWYRLWLASKERLTLSGHADRVLSMAFAPDGQTLASASGDKTVKLWEVANKQKIVTLKDHTDPVYAVTFARNGKTLASAGGYSEGKKDYAIRLWFAATEAEVTRWLHR